MLYGGSRTPNRPDLADEWTGQSLSGHAGNLAWNIDPVTVPREGTLSAQALLSYKLNWQSVLFVGYGDDRDRTDQNDLVKTGRQVFVKASYAFQR